MRAGDIAGSGGRMAPVCSSALSSVGTRAKVCVVLELGARGLSVTATAARGHPLLVKCNV